MSSQGPKDNWSSEAYQNSAAFVPQLAGKIVEWLAPEADDKILDIGCGDGVVDFELAGILRQGSGLLHGIDSSKAMITAAQKVVDKEQLTNCTFEAMDALDLLSTPKLQQQSFNKLFSNAALHWILRPPERRAAFFRGAKAALAPGGIFAFEMGGLGNIQEVSAALLSVISRRIGIPAGLAANPWFFPDEDWMRHMLEQTVGGWKVERAERVWRPTPLDPAGGGVDGWVRLMGKPFFDAVPEGEREACIREAVDVLEHVCAFESVGEGGAPTRRHMLCYVRLRVLARRVD